jgi:hypothetical protein
VERNSALLQPRRSPGRERAAEAASSRTHVSRCAAGYADENPTTSRQLRYVLSLGPPETALSEWPVVLLK